MAERAPLTRAALVDAAVRLLDEVGLDGLTVRRLAADLGVRSPALYWHIRTKQELLDGIADRIVRAAGMGPPRPGEDWRDWLVRRATAYRRSLLAHRDGARIVATARALDAETVRTVDRELAALVERGFTPELALRTISVLTYYVNGFVQQEQLAVPQDRPATEQLPVDDRSPLVAAYLAGASPLGEETFTHGLRALVQGTAALLPG